MRQRAFYGTADLVVEIRSPNDPNSHLFELESDFRAIGVPEIVFVDAVNRKVRVVRKQEGDYLDEEISKGALILDTMNGLTIPLAWLFDEPRPKLREALSAINPKR
jgi:Uma2 family endonuclease